MRERQTGTIKWFNDSQGFGFITAIMANALSLSIIRPPRRSQEMDRAYQSLALFVADLATVILPEGGLVRDVVRADLRAIPAQCQRRLNVARISAASLATG